MDEHFFGFALGLPFPPIILEFPDDFFLFRVHRDHRLPSFLKRDHGRIDMLELGVAIWMTAPFFRLAVALQTIPRCFQQSPNRARADGVPLSCQLVRQLCCALACPTQRRLRIASRHRIDQFLQTRCQLGINRREPFATATGFSQPRFAWSVGISFSHLQFRSPHGNRSRRNAGGVAYGPQTTTTIRSCFRCRPLTTHPFVHQRSQRKISRFNPLNGGCILHGRLVPETKKVIKLF